VRLQGGQAHQVARFGQLAQVLRRLALKTTVASAAMTPLTQIMAALSLSMVLVIALYQSQNGASGATVGGFVAFITAMLMLVAPIKRLAEISSPITRGLAALERGLALIHEAKEETQGTHTSPRAQGEVEWRNVHLQFSPDGQTALSGVNLKVKPGETVALVGTSGAGKTTLIQLLPRFVQATAGRVCIDGVPIEDWTLDNARSDFRRPGRAS